MWHRVTDIRQFVKDFLAAGYDTVACDTETYFNEYLASNSDCITKWIMGNPNNCPFCVTMATADGEGWFIEEDDIQGLRPILCNPNIKKVWHNAKFDLHMLANIGIEGIEPIEDTMVMINLINEEQYCRQPDGLPPKKSKRLKDLAYHFLGDDGHKYEDAIIEVKKAIAKERGCSINDISYKDIMLADPEAMVAYATSDTDFDIKLYNLFLPRIAEQQLEEAYARDKRALLAIRDIERNGVLTDRARLETLQTSMLASITQAKDKLFRLCDDVFNPNSADETVAQFEKLGLHWEWFTTKAAFKTDKPVLEYIIKNNGEFDEDDKYTPANKIGDFAYTYQALKKTEKNLSTFVGGLLQFAGCDTRVHTDFNICPQDDGKGSTVTGRLSSTNPNMQNLSKKNKEIRKCIVAPPGSVLVEQDFSQQEYRLLAHYSKDAILVDAIKHGLDIHKATATLLNHIKYEDVTKEQRKRSKTINFSLVYGIGNAQFAYNLGFKIDINQYNMGSFFIREKNLKPWKTTVEQACSLYVDNPMAQAAIRYFFSEEAAKAMDKAKEVKEAYFAQFPTVQDFLEDVKQTCRNRGYIKMWDGRRRHFLSPKAEAYKAPNSLIQGGCGSITKEKLVNCNTYLQDNGFTSRIVSTVHDSILFEINLEELGVIPKLKEIIDDNPQFRVPVTCDMAWGLNWAEMTDFKDIEEIEEGLKC